MKIKHEKTLLIPDPSCVIASIECCSWSGSGNRLAVCTSSNNHLVIFSGPSLEKKEKFSLRAVDKEFSRSSFAVKGVAFSPDSNRIAVGQTDNVIYVYKVSEDASDKKSVVAKYALPSACTCLYWHDAGIVFGSADGKVKLIQTATNRMASVISSNAMVISMAVAADDVVVGFLAGAVIFTTIGSRDTSRQIATTTTPPFALALTMKGEVCIGGCDGKITFISLNLPANDPKGKQSLEFGSDINCCSASPSGNMIVVASQDKLVIFMHDKYWRQNQVIEMTGGFLVTCISWAKDGTKMMAATVNGGAELFSIQWKKKVIGDRFQVDYVGGNQVVITDLSSGLKAIFKSSSDIQDVKVVREFFAVIRTQSTLIVGDMRDPDVWTSEVEWTGMAQTGLKFNFDYDNVVLVNIVGELYLIELGVNDFLASVRTDFVNPHLMSVRINERKSGVKVLAYLLDQRSICIMDLVANIQLCVWSHESRVDWIELNETGKKLLFRDKSMRLHLLDVMSQESQVLLNVCGFVQWVPNSDVIVAQSGEKLFVWYDLQKPVIHEIPGGSRIEATGIEREAGVTRVTFSSGPKNDVILDEAFLEFDTALNDGDLERAMFFLESCDLSAESESMWRTLAHVALRQNDLMIAERCFAATGDMTKAAFVKECASDLSRLALLEKDWSAFEMNDVDEALDTYIRLNKWTRAIDLAQRSGRLDMKEELEGRYFKWLMETGQEADAGALKEKAGQIVEAVKLYQKSGRIVQAARVLMDHSKKSSSLFSVALIESILKDLKDSSFHMEAGQFYEKVMRDTTAALDCYIKAKAFDKAIELARKEFPDEVVNLESQYGEYLLTEARDPASAVSHLIEAGKTLRALEAAIQANQFERAAEISSVMDKVPAVYGKQIAEYYASRNDMDAAMEVFISCGLFKDALTLLNSKGQYIRSLRLARKFMSDDEAVDMMSTIASKLEEDGKYKEAEKVYLTINDTDAAITMYKNIDQHDDMIRLVKQYHPDLLTDTYVHLAKEMASAGKLPEAESHYLSANDWKAVVQMYTNCEKWEDAYRVARSYGGSGVAKQVAYLWAESLQDASSAVKLLTRIGLLHQVIDFAIETTSFAFAHDLVTAAGPDLKFKMNEIKFKNALHLEKEGRLQEAEQMFLQASRAKEAVLMYVQANSFPDAIRVTEAHISDESALSDVLVAQAKYMLESGGQDPDNLNRVEGVLLRAGRIETVIKMYKDRRMWEEAFRAADQYCPHLLESLKREMMNKEQHRVSEFDGFTPFSSRRNSRISSRSVVSGRASGASSHLTDDGSDMDEGADAHKLLDKAAKSGDREKMIKYALMSAAQSIREKNPIEALKVLMNYTGSAFALPECRKILTRVAKEIFSFDYEANPDPAVFKSLRDALLQVVSSSSDAAATDEASAEARLLLISHYLVVQSVLTSLKQSHPSSLDLLVKVTTSLLRYTDVIRVDKAFYEAGAIAKEANKLDMAFVFWNHFLDLTEAIEESDMNVDHSDFDGTDIPAEVPLPPFPFYRDASLVEHVKSWILQISMESTSSRLTRRLPGCAYRDGDVYEASLTQALDHSSPHLLPCIVTGYPVIKHKMMELQTARYAANKDDWNKLLMLTKMSASEDLKDILLFIGRLCGNASVARFSFQ